MIIQYIKIGIIYFLRIILRIFYIIPINERKIIFNSWMGRQYACNPKYIFEFIYNQYKNKYIYIWSLRDKKKFPANYSDVRICGYLTINYIYSIMTAKNIVTNQAIEPYFPLRKNQNVIYTWHGGGAYKKVGDIKAYHKRRWSRIVMRKIRSNMITYVISSCKKFTELYKNIWNISESKFLPIGMPRNDILFFYNVQIKEKIYKYYNIDIKKKIILYAPTYRGDFHVPAKMKNFFNLDIEKLLETLNKKYNENFFFLYRVHYNMSKKYINIPNILSVSDYPDMQELLCAIDILITDYSSSIWDYSFTFKPCFIYAPDLKKYQKEQGFQTPIEEWPFPLAETNEQLMGNISNFNEEKYKQAVKKHHADLGSYESGTACEQFCKLVIDGR